MIMLLFIKQISQKQGEPNCVAHVLPKFSVKLYSINANRRADYIKITKT